MSSIFQWSTGYKVLLGLAGSYAVLSIVFFIFPQLIHKKKHLKRRVKPHNFMVIGHRGGACEAPENTIEAFEYARDIGVDVIELDCHLTKDKKIVVAHDNNLYRICGVDRFIFEYDFEELPNILDEDSDPRTPSIMKFFTPKRDFATSQEKRALKIPLLEEVFRKCPDMYYNIDLKANDNLLITEANDLITKCSMERKVVWGSFREMTVKKCQALNPDVDSYFSLFGIMRLITFMFMGILPFVSFKENHFEVLYPDAYLRLKKLPWSIYLLCWCAKLVLTRRILIRHLQLRGINVYFWVLNDEKDFESAIRLGVDGIMTDYPLKLIDYINRKHPELVRPAKKSLRSQVA